MKKLYVVGFGPGGKCDMTSRAIDVIQESDVVVGYLTYINLLKEEFPDKNYLQTGMRKEIDRCRAAIEEVLKDKVVSVVCSGDSGIYGLAGLVYELSLAYPPFEIEVVCGVTAASSGAAILGAPLTHDFAVISLSDLLTPFELIKERVCLAAKADFVLCFYNPSSMKRSDYLRQACEWMLEYKSPETICGLVRNIGREGESYELCSLQQLREKEVDMVTTVFVGNKSTRQIGNKMVTPRGYHMSQQNS